LTGHWLNPESPRLGNVIGVSYDEKAQSLVGEVEEQDVLAKAVDEGFYPDVSIGTKRRASDGKMYLHHLAYLGEEPPAIKDLKASVENNFKEAGGGIAALDSNYGCMFSPPVSKLNLADGSPPAHKAKEAFMDEEELKKQLEEARKKIAELEAGKAEGSPDAKAALEKAAALEAENARLKERLAKLAEQYPDAGIELSDRLDPRVDGMMRQLRGAKKDAILKAAAGKLPKAKQALVSSLADSLSVGDGVELSDGAGKRKASQLDLLAEVFEAIPPMVRSGALSLSDGDEGSKTRPDAKARSKMLGSV
jgi:regulator of replication initiation timing